MQILNDSTSSPLRFIFEDGTTVGQFYNSWDKTYHLAEYVPYKSPPTKYLCGDIGNFSASRCEHERKQCEDCFKRVASFNGEASGS